MGKDAATQVLTLKPMEILTFEESSLPPGAAVPLCPVLSLPHRSPCSPHLVPHPLPPPGESQLPQLLPFPIFSYTCRQKKTRADGTSLLFPCICHWCVETSLPMRRVQQGINSSLVTSPSLSVICKRPGLNCRFGSRLVRTHALRRGCPGAFLDAAAHVFVNLGMLWS